MLFLKSCVMIKENSDDLAKVLTGIYGDGLLKVISVNEKNRSVTASVPLFGELIPVQMSMDDVEKEERRKVEE